MTEQPIQGEAREGGVLNAPWNNSDKNHSDENDWAIFQGEAREGGVLNAPWNN